MQPNLLVIFLAALIPMVIGFIWYNPKTFGNPWMKASGLTEESLKGAKMGLIFTLSFVFSFMLAFAVQFIVIHQWGLFSLMAGDPQVHVAGTEANNELVALMQKYGTNFRTFKHGAFHGFMTAITVVLPVLGTNALFERKGFKYIAINVGYWAVSLMLMGGVICAYA